ncbi:2'-5' RNA ligase family protein [Mucilaginibacter sp. AW1-3]
MDILESTYCDYMMMISPPAEIRETVRKLKLSSAKVIGEYRGKHSIAHITVTGQGRQMPVMMKEKLEYYQKKLLRVKANYIAVKGFYYFLHGASSATIYARLVLSEELTAWFASIRNVFGDRQQFVPHITIVKDMPMADFKKLWPYFEHREFSAHFLADRLTVLSRPTFGSSNNHWTIFKDLYFKK